MADTPKRADMDWTKEPNYPRPDFLSSSRKRLAPQLLFKGGILHAWKKKSAVAIDQTFFATLPEIPSLPREESDLALLVYELQAPATPNGQYQLALARTVYTSFPEPEANSVKEGEPFNAFMRRLEECLAEIVV